MEFSQSLNTHIGKKIRERRKKASLSLDHLAQKLGISLQQLQKYEQGVSRVPIDVLYTLGQIFKVTINFFMEGFKSDAEQALEAIQADTFSLDNKTSLNILMVEDSAGDDFIMRKFIEECNRSSRIYSVHDGEEALTFLRSPPASPFFRPDIIILDLNIPKRDGLTVLKEIKRDSRIQEIPVIVITNSLKRKEMIDVYKAYASGYICKAGELESIRRRVHALVSYWSSAVVLPRSGKGVT